MIDDQLSYNVLEASSIDPISFQCRVNQTGQKKYDNLSLVLGIK